MPSSWSSLTPLLSIKRAFSSHRSKTKKTRSSPSPPPPSHISSPLPISLSTPPSYPSPSSHPSVPRFSRRDDQLRTKKYLLAHPTPPSSTVSLPPSSSSSPIPPPIPPRRPPSPSPMVTRRRIRATQKWPSSTTLLEWMEPSLDREEEGRGRRQRTLSEGGLTPSRSSFYSSESIPLPIRREGVREERGRGTTERVAAWIGSKSRERRNEEDWKRTSSERWKKRLPPIPSISSSSRSRSIDNLAYSMPAAAGCSNCMTKYSMMNREDSCSGCPMSFCKKCVQWRVVIPSISSKPVPVCRNCFERIERETKLKEQRNSSSMYPSVGSSHSSSTQPPVSYFQSRQSQPTVPFSSDPSHQQPTIAYITPSQPAPPPPSSSSASSSIYPSNLNRPWWNETDLPPPSMRVEYGRGFVQPRPLVPGMAMPSSHTPSQSHSSSSFTVLPPAPTPENELAAMEERAKKLKDEADVPPPSLSSLEERLAALRGVEVDLVRNPRVYLERKGEEREVDTVERLMEEARSIAILEERNDPDRLLEERAKKLMGRKDEEKKDDTGENDETRLSTVPSETSRMSEYSEATKEELADIEKVMAEAKKRMEETEGRIEKEKKEDDGRGEDVEKEMGEAKKLAAQLSLDVDKVNREMAAFWQKENVKKSKDRKESSSEDELDEETLASIVREAELAPDEEEPIAEKRTVNTSESSPEKKKGIFGRMFKK